VVADAGGSVLEAPLKLNVAEWKVMAGARGSVLNIAEQRAKW